LVFRKVVKDIAKVMEDKKAKDIVLLDLNRVSVMADYFIICTGESSLHMRSIAQELKRRLKERGVELLNPKDFIDSRWILLDFGGVIVHIDYGLMLKRWDSKMGA